MQLFKDISSSKKHLLIGLAVWLPMVIIPIITGSDAHPDVSSHLRFLVGVPLLILSAPVMGRNLSKILNHFDKRQLLKADDQQKLHLMVEKAIHFHQSKKFKLIIFLFIIMFLLDDFFIHQHGFHNDWTNLQTPESIWFHFISQPFYWVVQLMFILRLFTWWRIMIFISRLDLKIRASNGDQMGGLSFLSTSLQGFFYPVLAISITAAAGCVNMFQSHQLDLMELKLTFILFTIIVLALVIGPLLCFYPVLLRKKRMAIFKYNQLSMKQLNALEAKWFGKSHVFSSAEVLTAPDFSAAEDAESLVERVNSMKVIPLYKFDFILMVIAILLPFIPLMAMNVSWKEVIQRLFNFLL